MKKFKSLIIFLILATILPKLSVCFAQTLGTHTIVKDGSGKIIPWYSANIGQAYNYDFNLLWNYWQNNPIVAVNDQPHYMQECTDPPRAAYPQIGDDMQGMCLASWKLYYAYSGNQAVLDNAKYIADFSIDHGLTSLSCYWPNLLYPCNTVHNPTSLNGFYDGEMYQGKNVIEPHVSANFANELVDLYKITGTTKYLNAAINAANTLANMVKINPDANYSPWPFKINVVTNTVCTDASGTYGYDTHCSPAMELFTKLINMNQGNVSAYSSARTICINWLKAYPVVTNHWGNYFCDDDASTTNNTETNADELARWVLENTSLWGSTYLTDANSMLSWTYNTLGVPNWNGTNWTTYGMVPICEESREMPPLSNPGYVGNSHTARHYADKLLYAEKSGDWSKRDEAVRGLNWATYMVDTIGRNYFPTSGVWYTDGYGDYFQHYLRAMGICPDLAYNGEDHLLRSTSVVKSIAYSSKSISYTTYDNASTEVLRITFSPSSVMIGGVTLTKLSYISAIDTQQGYTFEAPGDASGVLRIRHDNYSNIVIR